MASSLKLGSAEFSPMETTNIPWKALHEAFAFMQSCFYRISFIEVVKVLLKHYSVWFSSPVIKTKNEDAVGMARAKHNK